MKLQEYALQVANRLQFQIAYHQCSVDGSDSAQNYLERCIEKYLHVNCERTKSQVVCIRDFNFSNRF